MLESESEPYLRGRAGSALPTRGKLWWGRVGRLDGGGGKCGVFVSE